MAEKVYTFTLTDNKVIERILEDDHAAINHMVLPHNEGLPVHTANSNVYMIVAKGEITTVFDEGKEHTYGSGTILNIAYMTKMNVVNKGENTAELFVVKVPAPSKMTSES